MTSNSDIRPSASVVVLRPSDNGFEILLLKRNATLSFAPNFWVFPGGKIEESDYRDGDGEVDAAYHAARRECQEEASITDIGELFYLSTWTAPVVAKRRFRTHLFVAFVAAGTPFTVDGSEIVEGHWVSLPEAVAKASRGDFLMMPPTIVSVMDLNDNNDPQRMMAFLEDRPYFDYAPKIFFTDEGMWALYPGDSGWESGDVSLSEQQHRLLRHPDYSYTYIK